MKKISNLIQIQVNKNHILIFKIAICDLNIHKIDLICKYIVKNIFEKILLKIKRKRIKMQKKNLIQQAKNIQKENNVPYNF